jgi:Ca2+/Na+ antiporter
VSHFVYTTYKRYLGPSIIAWRTWFKIPVKFQGVSVLAFATGAPDIITAIAAADTHGGVPLSLGCLYGSAFMFTMLLISKTVRFNIGESFLKVKAL